MKSLGLLKASATTKAEVGITSNYSTEGSLETSHWAYTGFSLHGELEACNIQEKVQGYETPRDDALGQFTDGPKDI